VGEDTSAYGAYAGDGEVNANKVILDGGSVGGSIYGGYSDEDDTSIGKVTGNKVIIKSGSVGKNIYGGHANEANATGNKVILEAGTVTGDVIGGHSEKMEAAGNTVILKSGMVGGDIVGGSASGGDTYGAIRNTIEISGPVTFGTYSNLYGGYNSKREDGDFFTGNTLKLKTSGLTIASLSNFEYLDFYLTSTATDGTAVITVTGEESKGYGRPTNIDNSIVRVGIDGSGSSLKVGDTIVLIDASGSEADTPLTGTIANDGETTDGTGMEGVASGYVFKLTQTVNQIIAEVLEIHEGGSPSPPPSLPDSYLSGQALLAQGADLLLAKGFSAVRDALELSPERAETFAVLGSGSVHHKIGSSNLAVGGHTLITGLAADTSFQSARLVSAVFFEYGQGNYDNVARVSGGKTQARGDTAYRGAGVIAELALNPGFILEGSLRGGQVETRYRSNDLNGIPAKHDDTESGYVSAHFGIRQGGALTDATWLEIVSQGLWTRQSGDKARLFVGEEEFLVAFDPIVSKRLRLGARLDHALTPAIRAYASLTIDHEFDGEAVVTMNGRKIPAQRLKGTTRIGEIGITAKPTRTSPFLIDVGIQGYAGRREGVTGSLRVHYFF
jgi:hypothetical protein